MVTKRFKVTGRVQGVGFRWSAQEEAQRLGLAGWIRNEDEGAVGGLVQGDETTVEAFVAWLGRGPRSARIDHVTVVDAPATGFRGFTIRP